MKPKIIVFDRDGTLNYQPSDGDWVLDKNELKIIPGTKRLLNKLVKAGYLLFIFTNQSCIGRGKTNLYSVLEVNRLLMDKLPIEDVFMCPHRAEDNCSCRKPKPGMLDEIKNKYDPDMSHSYVVGNTEIDELAARATGFKSILIETDKGIKAAVEEILKC